jgi:hypothetical protein
MADLVLFQHQVIDAGLFQVPADGQAGLSAADDDDAVVAMSCGWRVSEMPLRA